MFIEKESKPTAGVGSSKPFPSARSAYCLWASCHISRSTINSQRLSSLMPKHRRKPPKKRRYLRKDVCGQCRRKEEIRSPTVEGEREKWLEEIRRTEEGEIKKLGGKRLRLERVRRAKEGWITRMSRAKCTACTFRPSESEERQSFAFYPISMRALFVFNDIWLAI